MSFRQCLGGHSNLLHIQSTFSIQFNKCPCLNDIQTSHSVNFISFLNAFEMHLNRIWRISRLHVNAIECNYLQSASNTWVSCFKIHEYVAFTSVFWWFWMRYSEPTKRYFQKILVVLNLPIQMQTL